MKSPLPNERSARGTAPSTAEDEELETGEPIPDDEEQTGAKGVKIPARRPFTGNSHGTGAGAPAPAGQMVLSTAKYLPKSAFEPDPHERKKRTDGQTDNTGQSFEGKVFNSGVAGGLLAMGGATVWFVIGLMNDTLFFYPPILFVIGLGAVLKGMSRSE
jgi:hypothetical protein